MPTPPQSKKHPSLSTEYQLGDEQYIRFRDLLIKRYGLHYPEHKREDLEHGLNLALKATGYPDLATLYEAATSDAPVWDTMVEHLTIGETSFFRNKPQFDAFRHHIFPQIFQQRESFRTLRIWSAGCATGEEPYSIAMLLHEILPNLHDWHISILSTDINPHFLNRAREGVYGNWSFRDTPESIKTRFFTPEQNRWRIKPDIRSMVTFARLNLAELSYPSITNGTTALDIILCRNVTIYFDEPTTRQVVERFYRALTPGGWLIVGHSEPQASIYHQFEVHNFPNTVVYRKQLDAPYFLFDQIPLFQSKAESGPTSHAPQPDPPAQQAIARLPQPPLTAPAQPPAQTQHKPAAPPPTAAPPSRQPEATISPSSIAPSSAPSQSRKLDTHQLWNQAQTSLVSGNKPQAEHALNILLLLQPDHVEALTTLGRLNADRGEWACAQYHCETAIKNNPLHIEAHYILAQVYEHQEDLESALNEYRRTVYLDRHFLPGMVGMGNIWRQMGKIEEARRNYRNALKQLSTLAPSTTIPGTDGATASDLTAFITRQLRVLE